MSGSRGAVRAQLGLCSMVAWRAGLIFTRVGRRIIMLAVAAGFISVFAFPDALQGSWIASRATTPTIAYRRVLHHPSAGGAGQVHDDYTSWGSAPA